MAVASAGPYANHLHLAPIKTDNHASTSSLTVYKRMFFLTPNSVTALKTKHLKHGPERKLKVVIYDGMNEKFRVIYIYIRLLCLADTKNMQLDIQTIQCSSMKL